MIEKLKEYYVVIGLVVVFTMGWVGHGLYTNAITEAIAEARLEASRSAAEEIAKITATNTTIQQKIIERVRTETVYSECRHAPDTYQLIKDALK